MTTRLTCSVFFVLVFAFPPANAQKRPTMPSPRPIDATVCKILANPSAMNNRIVKVRGYLQTSFEYSVLSNARCPEREIWLVFADGSAPPQLGAVVGGTADAAASGFKARRSPAAPVHLNRDANYAQLLRYLEISAKGGACSDAPRSDFPPDCTTYRITATFTGRIDTVPSPAHKTHLKGPNAKAADRMGFGQMGMFEAQIVVEAVANAVTVAD
jgi:hypothetical protein